MYHFLFPFNYLAHSRVTALRPEPTLGFPASARSRCEAKADCELRVKPTVLTCGQQVKQVGEISLNASNQAEKENRTEKKSARARKAKAWL